MIRIINGRSARPLQQSGVLFALFWALAASAGAPKAGIQVTAAWSRALPPVSQTGAAYLTLSNPGDAPVALVAARSEIAERVEIHTHLMDGGVMRMRPVDRVEVAPGGQVVFEPGGLHLMLMGLREALVAGNTFQVELEFDNGDSVDAVVSVKGSAEK